MEKMKVQSLHTNPSSLGKFDVVVVNTNYIAQIRFLLFLLSAEQGAAEMKVGCVKLLSCTASNYFVCFTFYWLLKKLTRMCEVLLNIDRMEKGHLQFTM